MTTHPNDFAAWSAAIAAYVPAIQAYEKAYGATDWTLIQGYVEQFDEAIEQFKDVHGCPLSTDWLRNEFMEATRRGKRGRGQRRGLRRFGRR